MNNQLKGKILNVGLGLLPIMALFIFFGIIYNSYYNGNFNGGEISFFITTIKDCFNTLFFAVAIVITILTYLQAKKTLFTPIKTETFKMQIKAFEEILIFFQNKSEGDFADQFDLKNIVRLNSEQLKIDYIKTFFKNEIDINQEKVDEMLSDVGGAIMTEKHFKKFAQLPNYYEKVKSVEKEEITNPTLILKEWENYEFGKTVFTRKYTTEVQKLRNLSASPLIPETLKNKIEEIIVKLQNDLTIVTEIMEEISKELPTKFPNAKSLENFNQMGIWNQFNRRKENIENDSGEILKFIRNYLKIDHLIN